MTRISFNTSASHTNEDLLVLNPVDVSLPFVDGVDENSTSHEVIDGESIVFEKYFDSRRCKLIWENVPSDLSLSGQNVMTYQFDGMLATYVGSNVYMNLGDIGDAIGGDYSSSNWIYIKGISLNKKIRKGRSIHFSKIEFVFELAEE